jgi:hypothetical protein
MVMKRSSISRKSMSRESMSRESTSGKLTSRKSSPLSPFLAKRVASYAVAAGAAGVGLMALAPLSEAEIVYTPINKTVGRDANYSIDLNGDGIADFILNEHAYKDGSFGTFQYIALKAANGNQVVCPSSFCISGESIAAVLNPGTPIGPNVRPRGWFGGVVELAFEVTFLEQGSIYYGGSWLNARNSYAGVKFKIDGEYHYGWVRLSVQFNPGKGQQRTYVAQLTGFAYETDATKPIQAGKTKETGGEDAVSQRPSRMQPAMREQSASLGSLALGANGMALWRKEETSAN